uniref:AAA+ ATPase domain-containing protein n=1 Tax=Ciona savignyi TaxID=51511 RepID=H2ZF01_CIOSA
SQFLSLFSRVIMSDIGRDGRVLSIVGHTGLRGQLSTMLDQLQRCQRSLNEYLEEKRNAFPRFYFIGDDDLLEILGQSTNPSVIQSHLKKLFAGIHSVQFNTDDSNKQIVAMNSLDGEVVPLMQPVYLTRTHVAQEWLMNLSDQMKETLRILTSNNVRATNQDPAQFPSQVKYLEKLRSYTSVYINASELGETGLYFKHWLTDNKVHGYSNCAHFLNKLILFSLDCAVPQRPVLDLKLKSLILDIIHNIDVVEQLNKAGIRSSAEWIWQKQLRYYADNSASMRMVDAQFDYTFEYQGNAPKLVHTPLTDKCYLTLTQGMHMGLGGNPYGPAGTGKTESVKALGGLFGRQVLVFNCDEGIDVKSMGRIFIGLVKCGAWGCFDEFNRLEEVVLSTVSMDIQVIQAALKSRASNIELLGRQVDINPNSGIFITMNPAGKGYGGRQKLPDNLKQLFRPVAMSKPDNEQIAEVILFSEGFGEGKALGRKLVAVFNLAKELLTPQQHYDWGLRALKTVLRGSGQALHNLRRKSDNNEAKITPDDECRLVVQALRINTLSKLSFADSQRFDALVKDVFPNIVFQEIEQESLLAAIDAQCTEMHLDPQDRQKKKILELNEQLQQRMGVVIVGPSGSGKTSLWQVLRGALSRLGRVVKLHTMNPKSMPRNQLLGKIDLDTREWSDGVLTNSARDVVREPLVRGDVHSWIVCDGDIDPEWIESLNSVLDDNHLLTMPSGERIQFGPNVNFLFETHDLSCASPATISRMGMIFLSEEDTDYLHPCLTPNFPHPSINMVISSPMFNPEHSHPGINMVISSPMFNPELSHPGINMVISSPMFNPEHFPPKALKWVRRSTGQVVDCSMVGLVLSALSHLNGCSDKLAFVVGLIRGENLFPQFPFETVFNYLHDLYYSFDPEILQWAHEAPPDARNPTNLYLILYPTLPLFYFDKTCSIFDKTLYYNHPLPTPFILSHPYNTCIHPHQIETIEMQRCIDHIMQWMKPSNRHPFVVVGHDGCGKSLLLHHCFDKLRSTQVATIHCSAQTTPVHLIQKLQQACMAISGGSGRALRPRECENLVLYLKDINLPKPDKWGTSQTLAFLQQLLTYHGFYDEDNEWVGLDGIQIVASLNAAATLGRHKLSSRFTSRVRILSMDYADTNELSAIYTAYLTPVLHHRPALQRHPVWGSPSKVQQLATSMVQVYEQMRKSYLSDDHGHYLFTPRDLTSWCVSLMRYDEACMVGDGRAPDSLLSVWVYEAYRLFRDRIVGGKGKDRFDQMLSSILAHDWSINASECMNNDYYTLGHLSASDLKDVITKAVAAYSREVREIDILVFQEVLEYMARVDRVISAPGGSLLLAGRTGVGRRTAVSVCAHMHRMTLVTPKVSRSYGLKQFKIDLKAVMQQAGIDGEQVVLLMEDFQLVHHSFLELVNSLLSAGEVPGLYNSEELDPLLTPL